MRTAAFWIWATGYLKQRVKVHIIRDLIYSYCCFGNTRFFFVTLFSVIFLNDRAVCRATVSEIRVQT